MENKDHDDGHPPEEREEKDLMKSTLIALGWEENGEDVSVEQKPTLEGRVKELEEELAIKKELIDDLESKVKKLTLTNDALTQEVSKLEDTISSTIENASLENAQSGMIDELQEKLNLQERANITLQEKLASLQESTESTDNANATALQEANAEIERLKTKNAQLLENVEDLKRQVVEVIGENTGLSGEMQDKQTDLLEKEKLMSSLQEKVKELESNLVRANLAIDDLKAESEHLNYTIHDQENTIEEQKRQLLQAMSDTSENMVGFQQKIDIQEEEITKLKQELQTRVKELESIKTELAAKANALASLQEKYELIDKDRMLTQAMLDKSTRERDEYQERCFMQKNVIKKLEIQMDEYKNENESKASLLGEIEKLKDEKQRLESDLLEMREKIHDLEESKKELENKATSIERDIEVKNGIISEENARSSMLEADLKKVKEEKAKLEEEKNILNSKITDLENELEKVSSVDEELLKDVQEKETFYRGKIEELEKALGEAIENTMQFSSSEQEIAEMKEKLETKEKEIEKYKRRIKDLQDSAGSDDKDEEIKNLKINLKELRRRLSKYEEP